MVTARPSGPLRELCKACDAPSLVPTAGGCGACRRSSRAMLRRHARCAAMCRTARVALVSFPRLPPRHACGYPHGIAMEWHVEAMCVHASPTAAALSSATLCTTGKHRKHPGGRGNAGGQHHHRIMWDK